MSRAWDSSTYRPDPISKPLIVSLVGHALLVVFFGVKIAFFEEPEIDLTQAIRVDMVGLPDKITEMPKPSTAAESKPEEAKPQQLPEKAEPEVKADKEPEINLAAKKETPAKPLEKTIAKQSDAIAKLKQMQAMESLNKINNSPQPTFKGAVISPGTSLTGLSKLQHQSYIADLDQHIKSNWALPEWLLNKNLKAQIRVYLDSKGLIINRKIVRSSGNPAYDAEVIAAVEKSSPFPIPPEKFIAIVGVDGILIGFPE